MERVIQSLQIRGHYNPQFIIAPNHKCLTLEPSQDTITLLDKQYAFGF